MTKIWGAISRWLPLLRFQGSQAYWRSRYKLGGDSGKGSYGDLAIHKAKILNEFVRRKSIETVIEFGCGDGHQLTLAEYPSYLGVDISPDAIGLCRSRFQRHSDKHFILLEDYANQRADLAMSLDVIYHLVEDDVYDSHLDLLFSSSKKYVAIYSSSVGRGIKTMRHVRHRPVEADVAKRYPMFKRVPDAETEDASIEARTGDDSVANFFFYEKVG